MAALPGGMLDLDYDSQIYDLFSIASFRQFFKSYAVKCRKQTPQQLTLPAKLAKYLPPLKYRLVGSAAKPDQKVIARKTYGRFF